MVKRFKLESDAYILIAHAKFRMCEICLDDEGGKSTGRIHIKGKMFQCPECRGTRSVETGMFLRPKKVKVVGKATKLCRRKEESFVFVRIGTEHVMFNDYVYHTKEQAVKAGKKIVKRIDLPGIVGRLKEGVNEYV